METTPFMPPPPPAFYIDDSIRESLNYAAKWAKFIAIIGFICIGLTIPGRFFCGLFMDRFMDHTGPLTGRQYIPAGAISVVYIVMAVLYFFPCLYLIRFGVRTRQAFKLNDLPGMRNAFTNLHFFYRFIGILTIVWIIIGLLAAAGLIIGAGMGYMHNY